MEENKDKLVFSSIRSEKKIQETPPKEAVNKAFHDEYIRQTQEIPVQQIKQALQQENGQVRLVTPQVTPQQVAPQQPVQQVPQQVVSQPQSVQQPVQQAKQQPVQQPQQNQPQANPFASLFGNQTLQQQTPMPQFTQPTQTTQPIQPVQPTQTIQSRTPQEVFSNQLASLKEMGFYDEQENIRALQRTGGNVNAAVELLLQGTVY